MTHWPYPEQQKEVDALADRVAAVAKAYGDEGSADLEGRIEWSDDAQAWGVLIGGGKPSLFCSEDYGDPFCGQDCADQKEQNDSEIAYQHAIERYYGGSGALPLIEQQRQAQKVKR